MRPKDDKWDSSLDHFINFWWSEVLKKVKDAIVFIDNAAAECLHWNKCGAQALFNSGALGVKELSPLEVCIYMFILIIHIVFTLHINSIICRLAQKSSRRPFSSLQKLLVESLKWPSGI